MIIAVGGRPNKLGCPGDELAISSDDLFMLDHPPKKTLLVGASFIALECAGFLHHLGFDVSVMVRSILLRGFDQECANKIGDFMKDQGIHFINNMVPKELIRQPNGRILVKYGGSGFANADLCGEEEFDTVVSCVGRYADTEKLGLKQLGIKQRRGKILSANEQTSIPNIYGIGDVLYGKQELTPVAIQAGKLLARRLYGNSTVQMDYENVPMTVFTPLEYGNCGLTEEAAQEKFGDDNVEVYVSQFTPLEWQLSPYRKKNVCFAKLITKRDSGEIIGFHILSPNAGEITQGFGLAFQTHATYQNLMDMVGIHPTIAEEFTTLSVTKRSGASATKGGC
jgi:thioredoxin reductase (NADPH)